LRQRIRSTLRNIVAQLYWRSLNLRRSSFHIYYKDNYRAKLTDIATKYGTDKGGDFHVAPAPHNYTDLYELILINLKSTAQNILEIGIGSTNPLIVNNMGPLGSPGASLRMWREYFEHATVYGADIDESILFNEERISCRKVNQLDLNSLSRLANELPNLDFILDDGMHDFWANRNTFEIFFPKLKEGGIYIIEDVSPKYARRLLEYIESQHPQTIFVRAQTDSRSLLGDNNLIVSMKI